MVSLNKGRPGHPRSRPIHEAASRLEALLPYLAPAAMTLLLACGGATPSGSNGADVFQLPDAPFLELPVVPDIVADSGVTDAGDTGTAADSDDSSPTDGDAVEPTDSTKDTLDAVAGDGLAGDAADATPLPSPCTTDYDCVGSLSLKPCQLGKCNVATGVCSAMAAPKYWPCEDGDPCTIGELCVNGKCNPDAGDIRSCEDGNPCTQDGCDATTAGADKATGCVHLAGAGTCTDGNTCTSGDKCDGGICVGKIQPGCGCLVDDDCLPFEDGNLCNGKLKCINQECAVDPKTIVKCNANPGQCIVETCDTKSGLCNQSPAEDDTSCDDGLSCTKNSTCTSGVCGGGVPICQCASNADCAPFDDNDLCNGVLICQAGKCQVKAGSVITCPQKGGCVDNLCQSNTGKCKQLPRPDGAACEDGNDCTIGELCINQVCGGGTLNPCDDNNPCTTDFCAGMCSHIQKSGATCEDGDLCTIGEVCTKGVCVPSGKVDCDDKSPCTVDSCDPVFGCIHEKKSVPCSDGNACTSGEACSNGSCVGGQPVVCDDSNPCTDDSCDPASGCVHKNTSGFCDTGDNCTSPGVCKNAACVPGKNKCVECIVDKDCLSQDDGNLCNGTPICVDSSCQNNPANAIVCDKSQDTACSLTFCAPLTGLCQQASAPKGVKCDDGNACTSGDVCANGLCKGVTPVFGGACPASKCGDTFCDKATETTANCKADCGDPYDNCGDGKCFYFDDALTQPEDCNTCPADCGLCNAGCKTADSLYSGSDKLLSTFSGGATDGVDSVGGACSGSYPGNEFTYAYKAICTGPITITLVPADDQGYSPAYPKQALGLYVLDGTKACDGKSCLKAAVPAIGATTLVATVTKGQLYYLVVDGAGKPSDYEITLTDNCGPPPVCGDAKCNAKTEDCSNCPKDCGLCNGCGDGKCVQGAEDCASCPLDCGACVLCGDGKCTVPGEDCKTCPIDCKVGCTPCGDGKCDILGTENCTTCPLDCGVCPKTCQPMNLTATCGTSVKGNILQPGSTSAIDVWSCLGGNHSGHELAYTFTAGCSGLGYVKVVRDVGTTGNIDIFVVDPAKACDGTTCLAFAQMLTGTSIVSFNADKGKQYQIVLDSTPNAAASFTLTTSCFGCSDGCGNQTCDAGETCGNCPVDCGQCAGCGDKVCAASESCASCPTDCGQCGFCGDGVCDPKASEDCKSCTKDCGVCPASYCGDGKCDAAKNETCSTCAKDCGACQGGGAAGCTASPPPGKPGCGGCACEACVCALDDFCCAAAGNWTAYCASLCKTQCGGACP